MRALTVAKLKKVCDRLAEFVADEWEDSVRSITGTLGCSICTGWMALFMFLLVAHAKSLTLTAVVLDVKLWKSRSATDEDICRQRPLCEPICTKVQFTHSLTPLARQRTMIQLFMDWRHGSGRGANEKEIKRQWKSNVRVCV